MKKTIDKKFDAKRKGDISEMNMCSALFKRNFEVFKNIGATGLIDIVCVSHQTNKTYLLDVKTPSIYNRKTDGALKINTTPLSYAQNDLGVYLAIIYKDDVLLKNNDIDWTVIEEIDIKKTPKNPF